MSATRKIAGVDCGPQCFAHVGDAEDNKTFRLCLRVPGDHGKTINAVKSSLFRFHTMQDLPTGQRSALWNRLVGAAICLGVAVVKDPIVTATPEEIDMILAERQASQLVGKLNLDWNK